ncbi:DUF3221 domain-containing protein [Lentibacillus sp. N15]|uniref:DUF3221 domain-containing protein n=1 Tax=Lentibacillus songyuanensis TaxID=3136161 RepID=UPI0031BA3373
MKQVILFILISSLLVACHSTDNQTNDKSEVRASFKGTIKEINGQKALVDAEEGSIAEGRVLVDLSVNHAQAFQVGDKVNVTFDGTVLESNPAQIKTIFVEWME